MKTETRTGAQLRDAGMINEEAIKYLDNQEGSNFLRQPQDMHFLLEIHSKWSNELFKKWTRKKILMTQFLYDKASDQYSERVANEIQSDIPNKESRLLVRINNYDIQSITELLIFDI